jgi:hypothetical protein
MSFHEINLSIKLIFIKVRVLYVKCIVSILQHFKTVW